MRRFPLIDALRGLAAVLVLLSHVGFWTGAWRVDTSGPLLARGDSGVAVFFAISAFLLLRPFLHARQQPTRIYLRHRAARILPAYWVVLCCVVAVELIRGHGFDVFNFASHLFLLQGYTGTSYQAFTQTWSLTTEVTFYLLVPLLGPALARVVRRSPGAALRMLAVVAAGGLVVNLIATLGSRAGSPWWPGVLGTSVLGHAAWFAVGAALAVLESPTGRALLRDRFPRTMGGPTTLLAIGLLIYLVAATPLGGPVTLTVPTVAAAVLKEALYALLGLVLLAAAIAPTSDPAAARVADSAATRRVGDLSYAVFLWHLLVLQLIYLLAGWPLFSGGLATMLFAVAVFTALLALASAELIELPALRRWAGRSHESPDDPAVRQPVSSG
ncbi:acyltransferase family protein [Calidifontibacter terrae]